MFVVSCKGCGKHAAGISIVYPNPEPEFCDTCKKEKPLSEFHSSKRKGNSGHVFRCKECANAYSRKYRERKSLK